MELYNSIGELLSEMEIGNVNWKEVPSSLKGIEKDYKNTIAMMQKRIDKLEMERDGLEIESESLKHDISFLKMKVETQCTNAVITGYKSNQLIPAGAFLFNDTIIAPDLMREKIEKAAESISASGKIPESSKIIDMIDVRPMIFVPCT